MRRGTALAAGLALAFATAPLRADPVTVDSSPIAVFDPRDPERSEFGDLRFLGGIVLTSTDERFGGFSGLEISADGGRIVMVSDVGTLLSAGVAREGGRIAGLKDVRIAALPGVDGRPLVSKRESDAEAVRGAAGNGLDDEILVAFERRDRIIRYRLDAEGRPREPVLIAEFDLPENRGIESLAVLPSGDMLAIAERPHDREGRVAAWFGRPGALERLWIAYDDGYDITDAVALPDGRLVVLERRLSLLGLASRLRMFDTAGIAAGVTLDGEVLMRASWALEIDNLEGLAARQVGGRTVLTLVSDDNFNFIQRTIMLEFELLR